MPYFTRAQQLGATQAMLGCDRGLAYDLLGQQANAQADYRAALSGTDARRSSSPARAQPRHQRRQGRRIADAGAAVCQAAIPAARACRAFVLALTGDLNGAMSRDRRRDAGQLVAASPRSCSGCRRSAPAQKAAAVNLGIFPDPTYAIAAYASGAVRARADDRRRSAERRSTDRLAETDRARIGIERRCLSASRPSRAAASAAAACAAPAPLAPLQPVARKCRRRAGPRRATTAPPCGRQDLAAAGQRHECRRPSASSTG